MDRIITSLSMEGHKPVRRVRVGGSNGETYALFCQDNKVIMTDKRDYSIIYMVCDAELFLQMVGLRFVTKKVGGRKIYRPTQVK